MHWSHGELWLFQDGILRIPIGGLQTAGLVGYGAEVRNPTSRVFSADEFSTLVADPRNLWIPRVSITSATLRTTNAYSTLDLRLQLADGRTVQVLTPARNAVSLPLQAALREWLGEAFVAPPQQASTASSRWMGYLVVALVLGAIYAPVLIVPRMAFASIVALTLVIYTSGLAAFAISAWLVRNETLRFTIYGVGMACMAFDAVMLVRLGAPLVGGFIGGVLVFALLLFGMRSVQRQRPTVSSDDEIHDS
jgi:hypothetical protein